MSIAVVRTALLEVRSLRVENYARNSFSVYHFAPAVDSIWSVLFQKVSTGAIHDLTVRDSPGTDAKGGDVISQEISDPDPYSGPNKDLHS